jgi:uncharacterized protein
MSLANCKHCGRLFQRSYSDLCRGCYAYDKSQSMEIYRHIQENPGISMIELSEKFNTTVREIESLIFSGVLGTANLLVRSYCALCKCEMTFVNRIGHFCYSCNNFVEKEAGVGGYTQAHKRLDNIRAGHSAFYKPLTEKEQPKKQQQKKVVSSSSSESTTTTRGQTPAESSRSQPVMAKYGFKRISDKPKR